MHRKMHSSAECPASPSTTHRATSRQADIDRVREIMERVGICMLTTRFCCGLRARPLEARPDRNSGLIWFVTDLRSGKEHEIESEHGPEQLHYLRPLRSILDEELLKIGDRAWEACTAEVGEATLHARLGEDRAFPACSSSNGMWALLRTECRNPANRVNQE
jgi:hypothetical protein